MKTYFVLGLGCRLQNGMSTIISFLKISIITQLMVTRIGLIFTSILTTKAFHLHLESLLGLHLSMTVGIKDHTQEIYPTRAELEIDNFLISPFNMYMDIRRCPIF